MVRFLSCALLCASTVAVSLTISALDAAANGILITPDPSGAQPTHADRRDTPPPIRLTRHAVTARIRDSIAHVTVEHTFHSTAAIPLEGTYLFPLPDGAVVSKFAMTMGGKLVQGEVLEANEARAIYNGIVRRRQDPGLLEYMGRGLFRARVFPIPAGGDVRIQLSFQQVLPQDAGVLEFRYPLATDRLNGAVVDHTIVDIQIDSLVDIKGIYSPSHELPVKRTGERAAHVRIEQSGRRQLKDLLLYVSRSAGSVGFSVLSSKRVQEDGTFMAVLAPRASASDSTPTPKDVVFVLDTSGSMKGEKIEQARAALAHGIRTLHEGDRFNLLSFSSGMNTFRDELIKATREGQAAAIRWLHSREAGGATNIEGALKRALAMHVKGRLSLIVFITDGKPTVGVKTTQRLVKLVADGNRADARVFTFGVGFDLDVALLDRIAEKTGGTRDYVAPGEDIEIVTSRFFHKVGRPMLTNLRVSLGPDVYDVYPSELPDLFAGSQIVVYGRYKTAGPRTLTLHGERAGKQIIHEIKTSFSAEETHDFLPRLWANRKVMYLLDQVRLHGENKEVTDEIIALATRHAIVTPYTAGLVVEEGELGSRRVLSANPLFQIGGRYRGPGGPGGPVPPSLREPSDPSPLPPPPPSGPPTTPPPAMPTPMTPPPMRTLPSAATKASQDLKRRKAASGEIDDAALRGVRRLIMSVAGKTFMKRPDGRWIDTAWDGKQETEKVIAFSTAYFELIERNARIAKYLAVGTRVVFVLGTTAYEIVPATNAKEAPRSKER